VVEPEGDGWVSVVVAGEQRGDVDRADVLDGADRELSAHKPADSGDGISAGLGGGACALCRGEERSPGFG